MSGDTGKIDLNAIWQRALDLMQSNLRLLAIVAGVFLLLPSLVMYLAIPELADMGAMMEPDRNADPEKLLAQLGDLYASIAPGAILASIFSFVGYSALVALLGDKGITVGEAIVRGAKSLPTLVGVMILFGFACVAAAFAIFLPVVLLATLSETVGALLSIVAVFVILGMMLFLIARFSVTMPIIILEKNLNPFTAMVRSWRLTGQFTWAIFGFWTLLILVYMVISVLIGGLVGVIAALASGSTAAFIMGLFNGLIGAIVGIAISGIAVALFERLVGDTPESIDATFG